MHTWRECYRRLEPARSWLITGRRSATLAVYRRVVSLTVVSSVVLQRGDDTRASSLFDEIRASIAHVRQHEGGSVRGAVALPPADGRFSSRGVVAAAAAAATSAPSPPVRAGVSMDVHKRRVGPLGTAGGSTATTAVRGASARSPFGSGSARARASASALSGVESSVDVSHMSFMTVTTHATATGSDVAERDAQQQRDRAALDAKYSEVCVSR
jgi:hypothetical protein